MHSGPSHLGLHSSSFRSTPPTVTIGRPSARLRLAAAATLVVATSACGSESGIDSWFTPDETPSGPASIRPVVLSTTDRPATPNDALLFGSVLGRISDRYAEEIALRLELSPATVVEVGEVCSALGTDAADVLYKVTAMLSDMTDGGRTKLQVLVPCSDPGNQASGVATVGGPVSLVFDDGGLLGNDSSDAYLTTVGAHELGHTLGLVHNSVGDNCMGAWETLDTAQTLLGSDGTARCVLLPHQRETILASSSDWVTTVAPESLSVQGPDAVATATNLGSGWSVEVAWAGSTKPPSATGWHVRRDGVRIGQVPIDATSTFLDEDREADYHEDPAMPDPGLVAGGRYCYDVALHDAAGDDGPYGSPFCVTLGLLP